jgi:hypothetical protein
MPIDEQAMIEAIMQVRGQIDFLWQFFVSVQLALFALIFLYDEAVDSLNVFARFLTLIGLGMFSWINGNALKGAYSLIDAFHQQYRVDYGSPGRFQEAFMNHFVNMDYGGREKMIMLTHGLAFVVIVLALLAPSFVQHRRRH